MKPFDDISITAMHRWRLWIPGALMVLAAVGSFAPNSVASVTGLPSHVIESTAALIFVIVLIAMVRAALSDQKLTSDGLAEWKFYGEHP